MRLSGVLRSVAACASFAAAVTCVLHFLAFLVEQGFSVGTQPPVPSVAGPWVRLAIDGALVAAFGFLHTFLREEGPVFEGNGARLGSFAPQRSFGRAIYVMATAGVGEVVRFYWQPTPELVVWDFRETVGGYFASIFYVFFIAGAILTLFSVLTMDVTELLGLRQAIEGAFAVSEEEYDPPMRRKDTSTRILFSHARHPMLTGPALLLFSAPLMTLDRFSVALWLVTYMCLRHGLDEYDVAFAEKSAKEQMEALRAQRPR